MRINRVEWFISQDKMKNNDKFDEAEVARLRLNQDTLENDAACTSNMLELDNKLHGRDMASIKDRDRVNCYSVRSFSTNISEPLQNSIGTT